MTEPAVNTKVIKEKLAVLKGGRFKTWLDLCAHCGYCAQSCFFVTAHNRDPKYTPAHKFLTTLGKLYKQKGEVSREELEEMAKVAYGDCTACRRCSLYCPFGIDIAVMIAATRAILFSQGLAPKALLDAIDNYTNFGNQMGLTNDEFVETCEWMEEEYEEELRGLKIPVEKEGADMLYTINAREAKFYPQDIGEAAMIFHLAGENWTFPRTGWDDTNLAMFAGDIASAGKIAKAVYESAERLGVKKIGVTECGHAYRNLRYEAPYWLGLPGGQPPLPVIHSVQLFYEYLSSGRIKIDPDKRITEAVTYQDPCNISRSGGLWEEARYLLNAMCTDFRDMTPNGEYNHCCGGGGGYVPMGPEFKLRRMQSGKVKAEQIRKTGAKILVVPCHNCFDQINDLSKEYNLGLRVVHFKTLLTEMLIIPEEMQPEE